jgi:hypothetical protein
MANHGQTSQPLFDLYAEMDKHDDIPCQDLPEVFFPEDYPDKAMRVQAIKVAKNLCNQCPIKMQCLYTAIVTKQAYGVWGGTTANER